MAKWCVTAIINATGKREQVSNAYDTKREAKTLRDTYKDNELLARKITGLEVEKVKPNVKQKTDA